MPAPISSAQFPSQSMGPSAGHVSANIGKVVSANGGMFDFSQAKMSSRVPMASSISSMSSGSMNSNIGKVISANGGQFDFSQATMSNRTPRGMSSSTISNSRGVL